MGIFSKDPQITPVEDKEYNGEEEAVAAHDEQDVQEEVDTSVDTEAVQEEVPEEAPTDGALPHNTNDSLERIHESNDEANNPVVTDEVDRDTSVDRKEDETQAEYNERVPVAVQPVQPSPVYSYLGDKL